VKWRKVILISALLCLAGAALWLWRDTWRERRFLPQLRAAAARYGVDPFLVRAVAWRESRFNPNARGTKGEIGLMQILGPAAQEWADAEHAARFKFEQCFDPATNALAATFYLGKLLKRYGQTDDPMPYALADYNAGRGNVLKWNTGVAATNSAVFIAHIGFPGTKAYVKSVLRRRAFYQWLARW